MYDKQIELSSTLTAIYRLGNDNPYLHILHSLSAILHGKKYTQVIAHPTPSSTMTTENFQELTRLWGKVEDIHKDNGKQFVIDSYKAFLSEDITQTATFKLYQNNSDLVVIGV